MLSMMTNATFHIFPFPFNGKYRPWNFSLMKKNIIPWTQSMSVEFKVMSFKSFVGGFYDDENLKTLEKEDDFYT